MTNIEEQIKDNWFVADGSRAMREAERDQVIAEIKSLRAERDRLREALEIIAWEPLLMPETSPLKWQRLARTALNRASAEDK